ncbi:histidine kinase [Cohnella panacarvi]|uniref:histidine kinase n=1 Tax=Cohnella panacarvi TaxID=400776 RepID=UPI00047CD847|nr:histidine kinase [Cohnella panacarvi]
MKAMKLKLGLIAAAFFLLFGARLIWTVETGKDSPRAEAGVLDLTQWKGSLNDVLALRGEWTFYPGVLLEPGERLPDESQRRVISVPGGWDHAVGGDKPTAIGVGTYRLLVRLPEQEDVHEPYGLRVQRIRTAHKLFVDGKWLGQQGVPGASSDRTTAGMLPYTASFEPSGGQFEVLIQTANFHYGTLGGIFDDIQFGSKTAIERESKLAFGGNSLMMGFYIVSGVYFLLLYLFRKRHPELLYFSCVFWSSLLFWGTHGERLLLLIFPPLNYEWQSKLQMLSSLGIYSSLLLFVRAMFPGFDRPRVTKPLIAIAGAIALFTIVTEVQLYSRYEAQAIGGVSMLFFYALYILVRAGIAGAFGSIYIFIAALSILSESLMQLFVYSGMLQSSDAFPAERLMFIFCMAILIARRFFTNMDRVEVLSKELQLKDRLKDDFLANTSQEIRAPLQAMINLAQLMLEEKTPKDQTQTERLQLMVATGRRMSQQLSDMMDLTKLNEGNIELHLHAVDVRMTINGAIEVMRYMTGGRDIRFDNQTSPGLPYAKADDQRVMQLLFNLLHHAVKSGAEGSVTVKASRKTGDNAINVQVTASRSDPGFGAEVAQESAVDADIGLAISRKLAEMHGGRFVANRPSRHMLELGFTLPLADPAETAVSNAHAFVEAGKLAAATTMRKAAKKDESVKTGAQRVLIVENDPVSLQIMEHILIQEGLEVTIATDGLEGLRIWEREAEWDMVVLNVMLPRLTGYDLCRKIRERHTFYDLPVLFLTSRHQPADLLVGYNAGANDYAIQPINDSEFRARTRTLLRMKQSIRDQLHMEMALIQAQIKPHFLYNTLNTIASLSEIDPERTRELLNDFGSYLRSSFDLRNLDRFVSFGKEWTLVHSYLQIEQARFGGRMSVTTMLAEHPNFSLPPLTIQPIVENALRHGILTRFEGGHLHIEVSGGAGGYLISIRDNGVGFPQEKIDAVLSGTHRGGIGLVNVHQRLRNAFGTGLTIKSTVGEGTEVSFRVPAMKEDNV